MIVRTPKGESLNRALRDRLASHGWTDEEHLTAEILAVVNLRKPEDKAELIEIVSDEGRPVNFTPTDITSEVNSLLRKGFIEEI